MAWVRSLAYPPRWVDPESITAGRANHNKGRAWMADPGFSAGEAGGVFAGIVALLAALGKGVKWLLGFRERQAVTRAAKLQAWHDELEARERRLEERQAEYQASIERKLKVFEGQNMALRMAFEMVAAPLRALEPHNRELAQAEQLLRAAFPLDPDITPDFKGLLGRIEKASGAG